MVRRLSILIGILLLAACGRMAPLGPAQGEPLPVKPLMAQTTPTAEELLTRPTYANPERVDELIKRSQRRPVDRFDLPPPDGGAAPLPLGAGEDSSATDTGPATPQ